MYCHFNLSEAHLLLLPPGGTNPKPEAPTTTPLVSEPGCVTGNRTGPKI